MTLMAFLALAAAIGFFAFAMLFALGLLLGGGNIEIH